MNVSPISVLISWISLTRAFFHAPVPRSYYAFGDSWSAGFPSAGRPIDDAVLPHCSQYTRAYPALLATQIKTENPGLKYQSFACHSSGTGVTLTEITTRILQHLPEDAQLVSIQGGLVDIGVPSMLHACDEEPSNPCSQRIQWSEGRSYWDIGAGSFYRRMLLTVQAARVQAPDALVVLLGYPRFYGDPLGSCFPSRERQYIWPLSIVANVLSVTVKGRINDVLLRMNYRMQKIANRKEFKDKVVFKDPDDGFASHHYCEASPWLVPYNWSANPKDLQFGRYGYFHPTEPGNQLFKQLLIEAWRDHAPQDPGKCMADGTCEL